MTNPAPIKKVTVASFIDQPSFKTQLMAVLPKSLTPERMVRIAMTELRMNPKLAECNPMSFAGAIIRCAQMGLEPSSERQHVHLIPFKNNATGNMDCQVIVGYRGFLSLAAKSNIYIESAVVCENDQFDFELGMNPRCKFVPCMDGDRGKVKGAYAMARVCLPDKTIIYVPEFMSVSDINKIMAKAKGVSSSSSPWKTDYEAMARKTAIRRLFKYLPMSPELDAAINADELADRDVQDNSKLVEELFNNEDSTPKTGADNLIARLKADAPKEPEGSLLEQLSILIDVRNVPMDVTSRWLNDAKASKLSDLSDDELNKFIQHIQDNY